MADDNKPRDIKNLKERLGRAGATPGQPSLRSPSFPPGAAAPKGGVRTPSFPPTASRPPLASPFSTPPGSGARLPSSPSVAPRPQKPMPLPGAVPVPGSGILAPPFLAQQAAPTPAPARKPVDPFAKAAVAPASQKQQVTFVVDESAIAEIRSAKKARFKNIILLGLGALLGIALGFMVGSTAGDRTQYNAAVRDGKEIYKMVNEISKAVDQAQGHVKSLFAASAGGPGRKASIEYGAIEGLVALKKPVSANAFHRKRYLAFQPGTVDDLFDYYNNINVLWDKFAKLGVQTTGKQKREALQKAASATDEILNSEYGMVMFEAGESAINGGLVFVTIPPEGAAKETKETKGKKGKGKKDDDDSGERKVLVSSTQGGVSVERKVFAGQEDLLKKPGDYVIMLDKFRSKTILGAPTSMFAEFRGNVSDINGIMIKTVELQGRLLKALGEIAALPETRF
jgi:hypothetical protein